MRYLRLQQAIVYVALLTLLIVTCKVFAKPLDNEVAIRLQAIPPEKLDPKVIQEAKAQPNVPLIVHLSDPFLLKIAREEQERALPELETLFQQMKLLLRPFTPNKVIPEPIRVEHRNLKSQQKNIISQMRRNIYSRILNRVAPQHETFSDFVRQDLQGNVGAQYATVNAVVIEIPSEKLLVLVDYPKIRRIILNEPLNVGFELSTSMPTTGAEIWHDNAYDGRGDPPLFNVGVLDSGVKGGGDQDDHQALPTVAGDGDTYGHGTKVAGVIASHDSGIESKKGMLPGISKIYSKAIFWSLQTYNSLNFDDFLQGLEWAVEEDIDVLNCSFGLEGDKTVGQKMLDYTDAAEYADGYASVYMISIIKSAGNRGLEGDKTITLPADSYNAIVVGAMEDFGNGGYESRSGDKLYYKSSLGPTFGGRKKPDITAPGANIMTTVSVFGNNNAFDNVTGTSVAAPHVTGAAGILLAFGYYDPSAIKALLLNSADDWSSNGPFPDKWDEQYKWDKHTGWGYLNMEKAWEGDNPYNVMTVTMYDGETKYYKGTMTPTSKAALVWFKWWDYDLSNFDMYLYEWDDNAPDKKGNLIDYSESEIDNVEQVVMNGSEPEQEVLLEIQAVSINTYDSTDTWRLAYSDMEQGFVEVSIVQISLAEDLNLIALPIESQTQETSYSLLENIPNCYEVISWDPYTQLWGDIAFEVGDGIIIGPDFPIDLGEGYCVGLTEDSQWSLVGSPVSGAITLDLEAGYTLISIPYPPDVYTSYALMDAIGALAEDVLSLDVANQSWIYASEGNDFPIETDKGYFVDVAEDTTFTPQAAAPPLAQENPEHDLQEPKQLFPKINNVMHANITPVSATICWNTDIATDGIVHYGATPDLRLVAQDTRGEGTNHWVVLTGLKENMKYYYRVTSGKSMEDNDGLLFQFTTSQVAQRRKMDSSLPIIAYGQVLLPDGRKAKSEIIFLRVSNQSGDSTPLATLTDANGYWSINLWNLKEQSGKIFDYRAGDEILIDGKSLGIHHTSEITAGRALQNTGLKLAPIMPQQAVVEIPAEMKLAQNFPNPFNPDTWIPYQLSEPAQVVINIYNVQGQLVRTLDLGKKDAGYSKSMPVTGMEEIHKVSRSPAECIFTLLKLVTLLPRKGC